MAAVKHLHTCMLDCHFCVSNNEDDTVAASGGQLKEANVPHTAIGPCPSTFCIFPSSNYLIDHHPPYHLF